MTDAPVGAPAKPAARPTVPARPRRSPTALTLPWTDADTVRSAAQARDEPEWLIADRLEAIEAFAALPIESNVLYTTYVDLRNADLSEVELATALLTASTEPSRVAPALPDGVAALIELDQGGALGAVIGDEARAAGLILETFAEFARRDPDAFRAGLQTDGALPADDKLAQLTRAFWGLGVHVAVPDGVRLEQPVVIRWTFGEAVALFSRTIIEVGEDAELKVVEELKPGPGSRATGLLAGTAEVRLARGSNLSFSSLQEMSDAQVAFQHRTAKVGQNAHIHWALAQLGTRLVRSRIDNRLEGDGSSVEQVEIVFGSNDQVFDLTSYTRHLGRDATSNLLSKAALQDGARGFLKGLVTIEKTAIGTDSFLGEYGMNLSKKARAVAIPSLEIDQPDCRRVAHSSAVGPIDENQLFYLESRGILPEDARKFIVLGFLEPVVARVPLESAQDRLRELLEAKWDDAHQEPASAA
jgi:Fe-S cluster assembly scaffold protein SufB